MPSAQLTFAGGLGSVRVHTPRRRGPPGASERSTADIGRPSRASLPFHVERRARRRGDLSLAPRNLSLPVAMPPQRPPRVYEHAVPILPGPTGRAPRRRFRIAGASIPRWTPGIRCCPPSRRPIRRFVIPQQSPRRGHQRNAVQSLERPATGRQRSGWTGSWVGRRRGHPGDARCTWAPIRQMRPAGTTPAPLERPAFHVERRSRPVRRRSSPGVRGSSSGPTALATECSCGDVLTFHVERAAPVDRRMMGPPPHRPGRAAAAGRVGAVAPARGRGA